MSAMTPPDRIKLYPYQGGWIMSPSDHAPEMCADQPCFEYVRDDGWMPIACAPTNGSKIDLWSESHYGNGRIPDAWYVGNEWFVLNGNGRPEAIAHHHNVTHWRPIHALTANHSAPVVEE